MAKIRSKLKRHPKGKTWGKGQSALTNPEQMKYRLKARSRYMQSSSDIDNSAKLQSKDLEQLNERNAFNEVNAPIENLSKTVGDIATSLKSFSLNNDIWDDQSTQTGTMTKSKVATEFSCCSNMTFRKFTRNFRESCEMHRTMLAILEAIAQTIKQEGNEDTPDAYFKLLLVQIENCIDESDTFAGLALLAIGMKSVTIDLLRQKFDDTATTLLNLLKRFVQTKNQSAIRNILRCLSVILRALDYETWTYPSTMKYFDAILSLCTHSKSKLRKTAQRGVASILDGSSFMAPINLEEKEDTSSSMDNPKNQMTDHPASNRITNFCLAQFEPEMLTSSQTTVSHTLALLKDTISGLSTDDIRKLCEKLLSIMSVANVHIRVNCLHILHSMFTRRTHNLNSELCTQLLLYLEENPPKQTDARLALAWITVLKEGYLHLCNIADYNYINMLPKYFKVCISKFWKTENVELVSGITNCFKEIIQSCLSKVCENEQQSKMHHMPIARIIDSIHNMLNTSHGKTAKYAIIICSFTFEACGKYFKKEFVPLLLLLSGRYDAEQSNLREMDHAIIAAIKAMGPECVLKAIPLSNGNDIVMNNTWILPLLRDGLTGASFTFFKTHILTLAALCNQKRLEAVAKQDSSAHIYELLTCQLYGLFPGFCRQPQDPENFACIAPSIGIALKNNPEFHAPILDGIVELLKNDETSNCQLIIEKYAKNFLTSFCRIYMKKPETTYEADIRLRVLEVFKLYLQKAPADVSLDIYKTSLETLEKMPPENFEYYALFDLTASLVLCQNCENIIHFFEKFILPILEKNKKSKLVASDEMQLKKQQKKAYELLQSILTCEKKSCIEFLTTKSDTIAEGLLSSAKKSFPVCQSARLHCFKALLSSRESKQRTSELIKQTIPEMLINFKDLSTQKNHIADEVLKLIADIKLKHKKFDDFVTSLEAFFESDPTMIVNIIFAFRSLIKNYGEKFTIETANWLLLKICIYLIDKCRAQAEAAIVFLITFIKAFPLGLVGNNLKTIMESLSKMQPDTKRYCRLQIGYILRKLCKRFRTEELAGYVPGDDELTHKRLKKISKSIRRQMRKKANDANNNSEDDVDSADELINNLEKKSLTIGDVLADSDSDLDDDEKQQKTSDKRNEIRKLRKSHKNDFIADDSDDELLDSDENYGDDDIEDEDSDADDDNENENNKMKTSSSKGIKNQNPTKSKNEIGGFKIGLDGKIIISDKPWNQNKKNKNVKESDESAFEDEDFIDSDDSNMEKNKKTIKRGLEDDSTDNEEVPPKIQKRKITDASTMRSGKTNASRYTTGGKGIHRNLVDDAKSVKSGRSTKSTKTARSEHTGNDYRSNKAKGDVKRKNKLEPYAYIELNRKGLNKRKRMANTRTFKATLKGITKSGKVIKKTHKK